MPRVKIRIPDDRRVFSAELRSPVGPLTLLAVDDGLVGLFFRTTRVTNDLSDSRAVRLPSHPVLRDASSQLSEYFRRERKTFNIPLLLEGSEFQLSAWQELLRVGYGRTISYRDLAARLGDPRKARAVGGAVGRNPMGIVVPCHRVVGSGGGLTGFGGGLDVKAALLDLERGGSACIE